jgi:hypothetical protein
MNVRHFLTILVATLAPITVLSDEEMYGNECSRFTCAYRIAEKFAKLEAENENLRETLANLEQRLEKSAPIAVYARLSTNRKPADKERIIYDAIITNKGKAYDAIKGQFTAPVSGIYVTSVMVCLGYASGQYMNVGIIKNGDILVKVRAGDAQYFACSSSQITVELETGDIVWAQREEGASHAELNNSQGWNTFTVTLINAN